MLPTAPDVADPNAPPQSAATAMRIAQQVKALPGIEDVAVGTQVPFSTRFYMMGEFHTERQAPSRPGTDHPERMSEFTQVSPNFFNVLRIPLLRGRTFTPRDGTNLILVNEAFAGQFFKGEPALGKRLYSIGGPGTMQIIGIVANTRNTLAQPPKAMAYLPFYGKVPIFQLLIRTTHDNPHLAEAIDRIARAAYPRIGNPPVVSLEDAVREDTANARASFILLAALTLMALILALAGIYGVVAFSTERRHHEIGVRVALGATKRAILRSILASALLQSAIGIAAGLILAAVAANAIDSVLFQTQPLDPVTFVGAALLLLACTALAAAVPAWRAMRVDPAQTLRYE
jgi:ABC-type antimicrobial peptide transport system permease subunit